MRARRELALIRVVVAVTFAVGCRIAAPDYEGKRCPCPGGWLCSDATQRCARSNAPGLDADGMVDDGNVDPDALPPLGLFGVPVPLAGPVNIAGSDDHYPSVTADGLQLFFGTPRTGGYTLWVAQRPTTNMAFGAPQRIIELDRTGIEFHPEISADGLELFFNGNAPAYELRRSTRTGSATMWNTPTVVSTVPTYRDGAELSPNGSRMYLVIAPTGGIEEYTRAGQAWTLVRTHDELFEMSSPTVSADGRELFGVIRSQLFRATRNSVNAPFGTPERVMFNDTIDNALIDDPELDSTGRGLYLSINTGTGFDIYSTTR
jgi:Tol biopolymer transport system component